MSRECFETLAVSLYLLAGGCTMDNPAFGEAGTGETGSAGDTQADDGTKTTGDSTGAEGGDGDAGDGDAGDAGDGDAGDDDTGDGDADAGDGDAGDGDAGDGDGEGEPPCETVDVPVTADIFMSNGPSAGNGTACQISWSLAGPDGVGCDYLSFGHTAQMWIGSIEATQPAESLYLARFDAMLLDDIAQNVTEVIDGKLILTVNALEPQNTGAIVWADVMVAGESGDWLEGYLDGVQPVDDEGVTTYKYQYYSAAAWPDANPHLPGNAEVGSASVAGISGETSLTIPLNEGAVQGWFNGDPVESLANGILIGSNASPLDLLVHSRESSGGAPAVLRLNVCY
jgi:hypothetical protein